MTKKEALKLWKTKRFLKANNDMVFIKWDDFEDFWGFIETWEKGNNINLNSRQWLNKIIGMGNKFRALFIGGIIDAYKASIKK